MSRTRDQYRKIAIADILDDSEYCFRETLDVCDLVPTIQRDGQLVPVLLRRYGKKFQLISGFRRVTALKQLGRKWVQARVLSDVTDAQAIRISLAENLERNSLSAWDQAATAARLRSQGLTNAQIAAAFQASVRTIQRYLRVAEAPDDFRRALQRDEITVQQAYEAIKRGVSLSELMGGRGRSVRYLRNLARKRRPIERIRIQRKADGEILISIRYLVGESDLEGLLKKVRQKFGELSSTRSGESSNKNRSYGVQRK